MCFIARIRIFKNAINSGGFRHSNEFKLGKGIVDKADYVWLVTNHLWVYFECTRCKIKDIANKFIILVFYSGSSFYRICYLYKIWGMSCTITLCTAKVIMIFYNPIFHHIIHIIFLITQQNSPWIIPTPNNRDNACGCPPLQIKL